MIACYILHSPFNKWAYKIIQQKDSMPMCHESDKNANIIEQDCDEAGDDCQEAVMKMLCWIAVLPHLAR